MLNKTIIIVLICFALTADAFAQGFDANQININIGASVNVSWFSDDVGGFNKNYPGYAGSFNSAFDRYVRMSPLISFMADYPVGKRAWVATGLAYSGRGGSYQSEVKGITVRDDNDDEVTVNNYYNFKIDYIELPLLMQYNLRNPEKEFSWVICGGLAPAVRVGSATRYIYYPDDVTETTVDKTKVKQGGLTNVNVFNLHPILGLQFGGNRDRTDFFFNLRFECSALPVFNNRAAYFDTQMWSGSIGIGVRGLILSTRKLSRGK